jgi:hypothetical protein
MEPHDGAPCRTMKTQALGFHPQWDRLVTARVETYRSSPAFFDTLINFKPGFNDSDKDSHMQTH